MTEIRALVIVRKATDLPVDHVTNTLHFDTDSPFTWLDQAIEGVNQTQLAMDLREVFRARQYYPTGSGVEVKMYDMQDPMPRPVRGHANWAAVTGANVGPSAPREVALCLSFRDSQNIKRHRGRIYAGPWSISAMAERPTGMPITTTLALAAGIANLGGIDIDWCVRSEVDNAMRPVKYAWVDDEWDTVRSRGLRPTARSSSTHDE